MTARVYLRDVYRPRRQSNFLEYLLLFTGLIALDIFVWVNVDAELQQAYDNWSIDARSAGHQPSVRLFLADKLGIASLAPDEDSAETLPPETASGHRVLPENSLIGRIEIPRLGLETTIRQGTDEGILRVAAGHVPNTALPGEPGNVAIAAHRDTFFRGLRDIRKHDRISVDTGDATYDYEVESLKIVQPEDVSVLNSQPGESALTLITCYPFNYIGSAPKRFIVYARQVQPAS